MRTDTHWPPTSYVSPWASRSSVMPAQMSRPAPSYWAS